MQTFQEKMKKIIFSGEGKNPGISLIYNGENGRYRSS